VTGSASAVATLPVIRALLDQAREKNYRAGVLGVQARPEVVGPAEFDHDGVPVRVVGCGSALAMREAVLGRDRGGWLVVLTDRDEQDLGYGLLGKLVWHRLRRPDPWDAVRQRFAAAGIDPALTTGDGHRDRAAGLLAATPPDGWPPAPGGVLTRDHALGSVARVRLGLGADGLDVDATTVFQWTLTGEPAERIADLRALAGNPLTDAVLTWAAGRCGASGAPLRVLLAAGAAGDVVPLGLAAGLLAAARDSSGPAGGTGRDGLIRLEARLGTVARELPALRAWGSEAYAVTVDLLQSGPDGPAVVGRALGRADTLLDALDAAPLAAGSDLLPAGLTARLRRLADGLRTAVDSDAAAEDPDRPLVPPAAAVAVERVWEATAGHHLAARDRRVPATVAAIRLVRWLATETTAGPGLAAQLARHRDTDAWVDSAVTEATRGVDEPDLGAALSAVLRLVGRRRSAHDRAFAAALAAHTGDDPAAAKAPSGRHHRGVRHLEDLLPDVVVPLARSQPVLLLVLDGMSAAVATEVLADVLADPVGWSEYLLAGEPARAAALAVLPTLTDVSRTSLLCGELRVGGQDQERRGYGELVGSYGLPGAALFHKAALDTTEPGHALAHDVAAAIDDKARYPLVSCVLNAIDDALDRSDPGGTDWGREAIRHLRPLLDRARHAGRTVVLTADHGHVVERRAGKQRPYPGISSGRSRPGDGPAPGAGEVLVTGRRVLRHDGRVVLAVDETLRYGPLKAGYHGGAAPAEAVVPVCVLASFVLPEGSGLTGAGPQEPPWWHGPVPVEPGADPAPAPPPAPSPGRSRPRAAARARDDLPALFDLEPAAGAPAPPAGDAAAGQVAAPAAAGAEVVAGAVLRSAVYRGQRAIAGRVAVSDQRVRALLEALLEAPDRRLRRHRAATALQVSPPAIPGAVAQVGRLLNVEGYKVIALDVDGETVVLDETLLREQFEVPR
jgi:hypothetical protein